MLLQLENVNPMLGQLVPSLHASKATYRGECPK